MKAGKD